ncbi:MAG: peptidase [Candidatus Angelobacter sp.]|nr:peptidase [Candidatus Angelobacter sp.]
MRKRYYIMFVARDSDGQLLKIPIPLHYLYVFVAGAVIGMFTITGMAGSYTRMLAKTLRFNQLRDEKESLKKNYNTLEKVAEEKEIQVASLGSLASEVSALYGLKSEPMLIKDGQDGFAAERFTNSVDQFYALRSTAMSGVATMAVGYGTHNATLNDWMKLASAPSLWPLQGRIMSSFGERTDPFNGEGAFHRGVDISGGYGQAIIAPADGVIEEAGTRNGYGKTITINHGHGYNTLFGHMSGFAVTVGQHVQRGDVIGYVGLSGRSTGPHVHYEVHINDVAVNPHKYMRMTLNPVEVASHGD